MVKVYLEDGRGADLIALFADEEDYAKAMARCSFKLQEGQFITESVTAEPLSDLLPVKSYIEKRIKDLEGEYALTMDLYWDTQYVLQTDEVLWSKATQLNYQIGELNLILKNCKL